MIAAAITRRLNVDPLMRTNGGADGVSATGTAGSGPNKISHYCGHLGCHGDFVSPTLACCKTATISECSPVYSPSIQASSRAAASRPYAKLDAGRPSAGRPLRDLLPDRWQHV